MYVIILPCVYLNVCYNSTNTFLQDKWEDDSGNPVSREMLMIALQNVQRFWVKVSDVTGMSDHHMSVVAQRGQVSLGSVRLEFSI